ncbi:uncharacterized protein LOC135597700 isoform X2 [Musa acuminata AAA Group]|uniref:uncharacterized protein LOC135597700 isoform X2 n=1 Tax=Musa acuminata AAA Group TaxID=214697 RepID=UPI0031CFB070
MRISWLGLFAHQGITTKGGILAIEVAANFSAATDFKLMHLVTCGAMLGSVPQLFSNACNWSKERNHSIIQQRLLATEGNARPSALGISPDSFTVLMSGKGGTRLWAV